MSAISLLFNKSTKAQIAAMQLDASISENHIRKAQVTKHPIEDGSSVSDHVLLEPIPLTITGLVSDVPITLLNTLVGTGLGAVTDVVGDSLGGASKALLAAGGGSLAGLANSTPRNPSDSFGYLEELWKNGVPFTVITALKRYEDMVIESAQIPRDPSIGGGLKFTLNLIQVQFVVSSFVTIPSFDLSGDTKNRGGSTFNGGKSAAKQASDSSANKGSFLLRGFQKAGVLN